MLPFSLADLSSFYLFYLILIYLYPTAGLIIFFVYLCSIAYYKIYSKETALNGEDHRIFTENKNFLIIGSQACGKSTLAKQLHSRYPNLKLIEFDDFYWKANWKKTGSTKFYREVKTCLFDKIPADTPKGYDYKPKYENGVIMDGNFNIIKELTWKLADVVIWLDYDFKEVFCRAIKRTIFRILTRQRICNGNVLTISRLRNKWKDCVIYKVWSDHSKINQVTIPNDFIKLFPNKKIIRLTSSYQCDKWIKSLE